MLKATECKRMNFAWENEFSSVRCCSHPVHCDVCECVCNVIMLRFITNSLFWLTDFILMLLLLLLLVASFLFFSRRLILFFSSTQFQLNCCCHCVVSVVVIVQQRIERRQKSMHECLSRVVCEKMMLAAVGDFFVFCFARRSCCVVGSQYRLKWCLNLFYYIFSVFLALLLLFTLLMCSRSACVCVKWNGRRRHKHTISYNKR